MPTDKPPPRILREGLVFAGQQFRVVQDGDDLCVEVLDGDVFRRVTLRPEFRDERTMRITSTGAIYVDQPTAAFVRRSLEQSTEQKEAGGSQ